MNRQYYLDLAASGLRMPIGADLVLREKPDAAAILVDGTKLGRVVEETARRFQTPLAVPLMDLAVEKAALLELLDVPEADIPTYHFPACPSDDTMRQVEERLPGPLSRRMQANADAVAYIAQKTDLVACGMCIGPFSLMTKLLADPITPVYLAGTGLTGEDDEEVRSVERCLELAWWIIRRSIQAQMAAGAKIVMVAEPAANRVYISPRQLEAGSDVFDRFVMKYNQAVRNLLGEHGVDLFFHCCGELTDQIVRKFGELDPAILSLGSSRVLWEDAKLIPDNVVLFGNLPSKRFFSDDQVTADDVESIACDLIQKMKQANHPFILGSECDVLSVPGSEELIKSKVHRFLTCGCQHGCCG